MNSECLDRVLQDAISGQAVLFLGAGASVGATNKLGLNLPTGAGLVKLMCDELEIPTSNYELQIIAQHYRKKMGAHKLLALLKSQLSVSNCPENLCVLLRLPWRRIYTTNFDNSTEFCLPQSKSFTIGESRKDVRTGSIIHLNGHINLADIYTLDHDLVLTDWSYAKSELFSSPWMNLFVRDIYQSASMLFAGYSMNDIDISRALVRNESILSRSAIVVAENSDKIENEVISAYGEVYPTGMNYIYSRLKQIKKLVSDKPRALLLDSLHEICKTPQENQVRDRSEVLFDQFVFGRVDESRVIEHVTDNEKVVFDRPNVQKVVDQAIEGGISDIVFFGNLGSGKTVASLLASKYLLSKQYRVFRVTNTRSAIRELDAIIGRYDKKPVVVVFENYSRYLDEIEHFSTTRRPGDLAILTARTPLHELFVDFVKRISNNAYLELSLDRLEFNELVEFDGLLNYAGLWKEYSGRTQGARIRIAQERFSSNISSILLDVVRSRDIKKRVSDEIEEILNDPQASALFTAALIINTLQYEFWVQDWQGIFAVRNMQKVLDRHSSSMRNFINLTPGNWGTNSSLLSAELLRNVISNSKIIETLFEIFVCCSNDAGYDSELRRLQIDLMRYNRLESVINEKSKYEALKSYFLSIRPIGNTANNSDYWLQYGIVLSIHGNPSDERDLAETELAFQNAYQREQAKTHPNTIRIDNYFSRFELQKAVVLLDHTEAGKVFLDASQKLLRQVFDEDTRHYPFKVGRLYTDVALAHYDHWNKEMRQRFKSRCKQMIGYGEERQKKSNHRDIQFLVDDLSKLLMKLD